MENISRIAILDTETSNQIAAGEVVERPVSVVKELVENSIDAGAQRIIVSIKRNQAEDCISAIEVVDNGIGMSREDLETAFYRHATSKIRKIDDLNTVLSLGFRGEALPSISSVSHVSIQSRSIEAMSGYVGVVTDGEMKITDEMGMPVGTKILVEDLFYNTPARKKFLKSAAVEQGHITKLVSNMILSSPEIAFVLKVDGRTVLHSSGSGNVQQAVVSVYGAANVANLLPLKWQAESVRIEGLVSKPPFARSNRNHYHFFVNGRLVKSRELTGILDLAYDTLLPERRYPMAVLYLNLPPDTIDVNVHPAKTEIRFHNLAAVKEGLLAAVKAALAPKAKAPAAGKSEPVAAAAENSVMSGLQNLEIKSESGKTFKLSELFDFGGKEQDMQDETVGNEAADSAAAVFDKITGADYKQMIMEERAETATKAAEPAPDPMSGEVDMSVSKESDFTSKLFEMLVSGGSDEDEDDKPSEKSAAKDSDEIPNPFEIYNEYLGYNDDSDNKEEKKDSPLAALNGLFNLGSVLSDSGEQADKLPKIDGTQEELFSSEVNIFEAMRPMGQLNSSYIIAALGEDLYIIDQHAAHERILYEEFCREYDSRQNEVAMLAVPATMELGDLAKEMLLNNLEAVTDYGFLVEYLGDSTFILRGVPYWFSHGKENKNVRRSDNFHQSAEEFFLDIMERIVDNAQGESNRLDFSSLNKEELFTMACKRAVKANWRLNQGEIAWLLKNLAAAERPQTCPHGRPTVIKISDSEIRSRFMRS